MISRSVAAAAPSPDVWAQLAAPLPPGSISWRQDGRPISRDGKYFARFVAYVDAHTVRERLDAVVPGEWDLTLELLPVNADGDGVPECSFKARLQILGVIREDVGQGAEYKTASTDAFKRAAVRFGIAHELYAYEQNWVQVDSDGKYAKPLEDPAVAYERRLKYTSERVGDARDSLAVRTLRAAPPRQSPSPDSPQAGESTPGDATRARPTSVDDPSCPKCGGRMFDNRLTKRNPKAPDYKCRSRSCDGVVWPPRKPVVLADDPPPDTSQLDDDNELPF